MEWGNKKVHDLKKKKDELIALVSSSSASS
jgi:hypothetical protein